MKFGRRGRSPRLPQVRLRRTSSNYFARPPEGVSSTLKTFLFTLTKKKGIERNLLAKKFIEEIIYSKENIKISLFYSQIFKNFAAQKSPALLQQGGASARSADEKDIISSKENQFEANKVAAGPGLEPGSREPESRVLPITPPRKTIIFKQV